MQLKEFIAESFKKEYAYRVKFAANCGAEQMTQLENALQKYGLVSAAAWKRRPIEENPMEFVRAKGVKFVSEVCATDVVLKYPVNERILEVWLAVNLGLPHERVLVYGVKEPRRLESENAEERTEFNKDRQPAQEESVLANEDQEHYGMQNPDLYKDGPFFGEEFNKKFLDTLAKIKAEKGADYFRNYPNKDELMGEDLKPLWDTIHNTANMGKGIENKEVDVISQSARRN
jgi:hypothetical protein